jgi:hypothetical protein
VVISHTVVLMTAFVALLSLPCALVLVIRSDSAAVRRTWVRRSRADRAALCLVDQGLRDVLPPPIRTGPPSIEHAFAELRRLHVQRQIGRAYGSEKWVVAVLRAYDQWLQIACGCLGISQHLAGLHGVDRQIERVRVESELRAAGLHLNAIARRPE